MEWNGGSSQEEASIAEVILSALFCINADVEEPTPLMAVITATKIKASITAYSTAVGPASSLRNPWTKEAIFIVDNLYIRDAPALRG